MANTLWLTKADEKEDNYETHNECNICSRGDYLTTTFTFLDRIEEHNNLLAEHWWSGEYKRR